VLKPVVGVKSQAICKRSDPQIELRMRLKELAAARVRYAYRRLHILLRREGWPVNHKRTYRLYREEGLSIRPKAPKRKRALRYRQGRPEVSGPNEVWAIDFMADQLFVSLRRGTPCEGVRDRADCRYGYPY
jgi:putative transposase